MQGQASYNKAKVKQIEMNHPIPPQISTHLQLQPSLIDQKHLKYKSKPYNYLLQAMQGIIQSPKLQQFLQGVSSLYNIVPYHNLTHAFDVMIACDRFLIDYDMKRQLNLSDEERVCILLAAYAHDNGHQGLTNNFYIHSGHQLALRYSNVSPLENMHAANLMQCLRQYSIPISSSHKQLMVSLILATDNKHHFELLNDIEEYRKYVSNNNSITTSTNEQNHLLDKQSINSSQSHFENGIKNDKHQIYNTKHRETLLQMIMHTADLSPCGKPVHDYLKWNERLYDQFKTEYRLERELKLKHFSFNFDLTNEERSMTSENMSFLNKMVLPFFKEVSLIVPSFAHELNNAISIKSHFQSQLFEIEQKKDSKKQLQPEIKNEMIL